MLKVLMSITLFEVEIHRRTTTARTEREGKETFEDTRFFW